MERRRKISETPAATGDGSAPDWTDGDAMAFVLEVSEVFNSTRVFGDALDRMAHGLRRFIEFDAFGVLLLDPLGRELSIHHGIGYPEDVTAHWRFGLGQGIVGTAAQTGHPLRVPDVRSDPRYINARPDVRSELAVPLRAKKRTIGVLDLQSRHRDHFTERHQRLLTSLAGLVANAVENTRLYDNLRDQARTLSLLHEAGRELASILDREALLRRVAELVKRIVHYQLFSVMLWNEEAGVLEHAFALRLDQRFRLKSGFPLGYGICGTVAALRQAVRVPNVELDPRYVDCGHGVAVRSELCVPLVFKDRLIGVVDLESVEYNAFSEQHEQMLTTLASNIAIAVENTRLYEKVRADEQRLAEDLATARQIQKGLLPEGAPRVPGLEIGAAYAPASQLGGDFYDFLPYGEGRLAVAVGDVAGKASAAALQGSLAIGIMRGHVVEHPCEPAEMLAHMNHHLLLPRLDNRFVAMAFGVYDARQRSLTLANAGFTRPRLVRNGTVEPLRVEGLPLGLFPDVVYSQVALELGPGDVVVFCSDGLEDCVTRQGEEFGARRMQALLTKLAAEPASDIACGLLRATDDYRTEDGEHADDRTVVVLKVVAEDARR